MFKEIIKKTTLNGVDLELSTGKLARQADGAVLVRMGDSAVLCTVVAAKEAAGADVIVFSQDYTGKSVAPLVSAKLKAGLVAGAVDYP
ncbi:MAG: hypothetical protein HRU35_05380, partial [Rickettsiaceae bacterium]|nr:hypothetical protein [Rickettsiaceae bacterium]